MQPFPVPKNEKARVQLLHELELLDTDADPIFDRITLLVKELLRADAALITLLDEERQWFKAKVGFNESETPRKVSFCTHVIAAGETMVIEDATQDKRFCDNPYVVQKEGVRAYAGAPITLYDEFHLGTLCVISHQPRQFSAAELRYLETFADWVAATIADRFEIDNYRAERDVLAQGPVCAVVWRIEPNVHLSYVAENAERVIGYDRDFLLRADVHYEAIVHPVEREELLARMQRLIDGEEDALEMDYRVVRELEGRKVIRWVHHFARADKDKEGNVLRVRGYLLDDSKGKQLELALKEANQNFDIALTAGEYFTWSWMLQSDELDISHRWQVYLGYVSAEQEALDWRELVHPDDLKQLQARVQEHMRGSADRFEMRFRIRHHEGHYVWVHSIGKIVEFDEQRRPLRMTGIHHDISEQVANETFLQQQAEILELVSHVQHEFMLAKDFSDVCDYALPKLMKMTHTNVGFVGELPPDSRQRNLVLAHGLRIAADAKDTDAFGKLIRQGLEVEVGGDVVKKVLLRGEPEFCHQPISELELQFKPVTLPPLKNGLILPLYFKREVVGLMILANTNDGFERRLLSLLRPMLDTLGTLMHMRRMDEERLAAITELRRLATTDELTGVANRRVFWEAMEQRFDEFMRYNAPMTVAIIDLDYFKKVNDTYGHAAGDEVLREFCCRSKEQLRDIDLLGRLGGEEFAILLPYTNEADAVLAVERIRESIAATAFQYDDKQLKVTMSAGVTELRSSDKKIDDWMARADEALYRAKEKGRNQTVTG
ncbi:diguanylate cyclase [Pseudidiomarina sp. CB1]|uniref:sensor domain-containing diguanylate cyclase n=1 Tax=Pseudidiomarina sp. CB1 TaxID=2972484 RepID=UPI002163C37D|nr:diguanylate cyclase [Pseudidiomarina sp. CB1]